MTLNCIIIDDSKPCINALANHLFQSKSNLRLIKTYTDPVSALKEIREGGLIDIVFMDILMPKMNGMQLARLLKDKIRYLIFTNIDASYAIDAFRVNACHYLLKPITQQEFNDTINKIQELEKKRDARHLFIKSNISEWRKIYLNDIIAVEGASNYVKIHTHDHKSYMTYGKMRDYEKDLSTSGNFMRVNKSFIISVPAIQLIKGKKITLINGQQIPIGDTYKEAIQYCITGPPI